MSTNIDEVVSEHKLETGSYLRSIRLKKGLSEDDIHKQLKIKPRIIVAIETHNYKILPDTVMVTALVRQYAQFLGLSNAHEMGITYKKEMQGTEQKIEVIFPDKLPSAFRPFKSAFALTGIFLAIYFVWNLLNSIDNILPEIMPISSMIQEANMMSSNEDTSQNFVNSKIATLNIIPTLHFKIIQKPVIYLKAKGGESWVEIKQGMSGKVIFSQILRDGQFYEIPHDIKNLVLKSGNSAVLNIEVNGQSLGIIPKNSYVLRNFNIEASHLLDYHNKKLKNKLPQS